MSTGTYRDTPPDSIVWLLAYAPDGLYYPQSPDACEREPPIQGGGDWFVPLYLGEEGGPPQWFDIVVVITDKDTSDFLGEWVKEGCDRGKYHGIAPEVLERKGLTEKDSIVVQTRD
jgi:hypothetical protein